MKFTLNHREYEISEGSVSMEYEPSAFFWRIDKDDIESIGIFDTELGAQQDTIHHAEEVLAEENREPEATEDRLYFYQTPAY